jgi:hypothetical protein
MKFIKSKKTIAVVAVIAVLAAAVGAYAYWTASGSGTGTAATGTSAAITVNQTSVISNMHPGDTAQTLSGNFTNATGQPEYVNTVTASIASVTKSGSAPAGTCDASDYTLANPVATVGAEVPVGSPETTVLWTGPTIKFFDKPAVNQDACKGATVNLSYAIG